MPIVPKDIFDRVARGQLNEIDKNHGDVLRNYHRGLVNSGVVSPGLKGDLAITRFNANKRKEYMEALAEAAKQAREDRRLALEERRFEGEEGERKWGRGFQERKFGAESGWRERELSHKELQALRSHKLQKKEFKFKKGEATLSRGERQAQRDIETNRWLAQHTLQQKQFGLQQKQFGLQETEAQRAERQRQHEREFKGEKFNWERGEATKSRTERREEAQQARALTREQMAQQHGEFESSEARQARQFTAGEARQERQFGEGLGEQARQFNLTQAMTDRHFTETQNLSRAAQRQADDHFAAQMGISREQIDEQRREFDVGQQAQQAEWGASRTERGKQLAFEKQKYNTQTAQSRRDFEQRQAEFTANQAMQQRQIDQAEREYIRKHNLQTRQVDLTAAQQAEAMREFNITHGYTVEKDIAAQRERAEHFRWEQEQALQGVAERQRDWMTRRSEFQATMGLNTAKMNQINSHFVQTMNLDKAKQEQADRQFAVRNQMDMASLQQAKNLFDLGQNLEREKMGIQQTQFSRRQGFEEQQAEELAAERGEEFGFKKRQAEIARLERERAEAGQESRFARTQQLQREQMTGEESRFQRSHEQAGQQFGESLAQKQREFTGNLTQRQHEFTERERREAAQFQANLDMNTDHFNRTMSRETQQFGESMGLKRSEMAQALAIHAEDLKARGVEHADTVSLRRDEMAQAAKNFITQNRLEQQKLAQGAYQFGQTQKQQREMQAEDIAFRRTQQANLELQQSRDFMQKERELAFKQHQANVEQNIMTRQMYMNRALKNRELDVEQFKAVANMNIEAMRQLMGDEAAQAIQEDAARAIYQSQRPMSSEERLNAYGSMLDRGAAAATGGSNTAQNQANTSASIYGSATSGKAANANSWTDISKLYTAQNTAKQAREDSLAREQAAIRQGNFAEANRIKAERERMNTEAAMQGMGMVSNFVSSALNRPQASQANVGTMGGGGDGGGVQVNLGVSQGFGGSKT